MYVSHGVSCLLYYFTFTYYFVFVFVKLETLSIFTVRHGLMSIHFGIVQIYRFICINQSIFSFNNFRSAGILYVIYMSSMYISLALCQYKQNLLKIKKLFLALPRVSSLVVVLVLYKFSIIKWCFFQLYSKLFLCV